MLLFALRSSNRLISKPCTNSNTVSVFTNRSAQKTAFFYTYLIRQNQLEKHVRIKWGPLGHKRDHFSFSLLARWRLQLRAPRKILVGEKFFQKKHVPNKHVLCQVNTCIVPKLRRDYTIHCRPTKNRVNQSRQFSLRHVAQQMRKDSRDVSWRI